MNKRMNERTNERLNEIAAQAERHTEYHTVTRCTGREFVVLELWLCVADAVESISID